MKNNHLKVVPFIFGVVLLLLVSSCSSAAPSRLNLKFTDSLEHIEELASQIVVGETSSEEVLEIFGPPFSTANHGGGNLSFTYLWRTTPIRTLVECGSEMSFDPLQSDFEAGDSYYKRSSDKVQLLVSVNPNGFIDGADVSRTEPHCHSCNHPFHE